MKKYGLPTQLFKILISLIISWFIISLVFESIFIDGVPKIVESIEIILSIIFALTVVIIYDYNDIYRIKSMVKKARDDVKSSIYIRKQLIEKAEKVVEKYVDKETKLYSKFADARKSDADLAISFKKITESYPNLNSNASIQKLMMQMEDIEKIIFNSKRDYSFYVSQYNAVIHAFPVVLVSTFFKWQDINSDTLFEEEIVSDDELGI